MTSMWFARSSQGYSGKGTKPTGYEHYEVVAKGGSLHITGDVAFKNFGTHRYSVVVDQKRKSARFDYGNDMTVRVAGNTAGWKGQAVHRGEAFHFDIPVAPDLGLPSLAARLLPMTLPCEKGELASYAPVPEDGFPWWARRDGQSWFPLVSGPKDLVAAARVIVGQGEETVKAGRSTIPAFRYDHLDTSGAPIATTWIGEGGDVVRYEQRGTVLVAVSEEAARALEPTGEGR